VWRNSGYETIVSGGEVLEWSHAAYTFSPDAHRWYFIVFAFATPWPADLVEGEANGLELRLRLYRSARPAAAPGRVLERRRGQTRGRAGGWHRGGCVVARVAARADVIDVMPEKEHGADTIKV
jgi:hypothetical protein